MKCEDMRCANRGRGEEWVGGGRDEREEGGGGGEADKQGNVISWLVAF